MYVSILPVCLSLSCVCLVLVASKKHLIPGTGVIDGYEALCLFWEWSQVLCKNSEC